MQFKYEEKDTGMIHRSYFYSYFWRGISKQDCTHDEGDLDSSSMFKLLIKTKALELVCCLHS